MEVGTFRQDFAKLMSFCNLKNFGCLKEPFRILVPPSHDSCHILNLLTTKVKLVYTRYTYKINHILHF